MADSGALRRRMMAVNTAQRQLYNEAADDVRRAASGVLTAANAGGPPPAPFKDRIATRVWGATKRRILGASSKFAQISDSLGSRFDDWFPEDLSQLDVLDLGCHTGHRSSFRLAKEARSYLAVDLSERAIELLLEKMRARGLDRAEGLAIDFLSSDFPKRKFHLVQAKSVLHHFQHLNVVMELLYERTHPGAVVLTVDPMHQAYSARLARALYRPFQRDRDWEWPFTRASFDIIERHFSVEEVQGAFGHAKWAAALTLVNEPLGTRLGKVLHQHDVRTATRVGSALWPCLFVATKLRRRDRPH